MRGPYLLRPLQVDMSVPTRVGGVYCLAKDRRQIALVGRADKGLRDAIKSYWNQYEFFWYEPSLSPREAFEKECYHYHKHRDCGRLEGCEHPKPPDKVDCRCPVCNK
ncbi:MAG: hypothetical protein ABIK86_02545 [candidate division WOR-3 bacterium]